MSFVPKWKLSNLSVARQPLMLFVAASLHVLKNEVVMHLNKLLIPIKNFL